MIAGLLTVAALVGGTLGPNAPQHFRIEMKAQQEADLTSVGGGIQSLDLHVIGFVSVTMTDTTGGQLAHIVIDSLKFAPGVEAPEGFVDEPSTAKGIFFHGYVVNGKVQGSLGPSTPHQFASMLTSAVEALFPGVRPNSKLGDTWTDTAHVDRTKEGSAVKSTTTIKWKVASGSAGAFTYEGSSNGKSITEESTPGGNRTVSSTTTGTRTVTGPAAGPIHAGAFKSIQDVLVLQEGSTDPIPVAVVTEVTITFLP